VVHGMTVLMLSCKLMLFVLLFITSRSEVEVGSTFHNMENLF